MHNAHRQFALFGVAGVAIAASLAMAALTLSEQRMEFQTYENIPLPFVTKRPIPLHGSIETIGSHNDTIVKKVFYDVGEVSQELQGAEHEDNLFLLYTPNFTVSAASMAAAFGYTGAPERGPEVYLYAYVDDMASQERSAQQRVEQGENVPFSERFPGIFAAMGTQSMAEMAAFVASNGGHYETMDRLPMQPNMLMLVVVNDTNVAFDIRCGNGITETPEECDDGNLIETDSCTTACAFAVCADSFLQPLGADGADTVPNGNSDDEQCDDGNRIPSDGCSSICQIEFCGDWIPQAGGTMHEQCDNGRACVPPPPGIAPPGVTDCDTYLNEQTCQAEGGTCAPVGGDGCSATCQDESSSASSIASSEPFITSSSASSVSSASSDSPSSSSSESSIMSSASSSFSASSIPASSSSSVTSSAPVSSSQSSSMPSSAPAMASSISSSKCHGRACGPPRV